MLILDVCFYRRMNYLSKLLTLMVMLFLFSPVITSAQGLSKPAITAREADSIMNTRPQSNFNHLHQNRRSPFFNNFPPSIVKLLNRTSNNYPRGLSANRQAQVKPECQDTSLRLVFEKNKGIWFSNDFISKTKDGNVLIPGFDYDPSTAITSGHLVKCTQQGDTLWSRSIEGGYLNHFMDVYRAFELNDASILLVGDMDVPMPYNGRSDFMMLRLSSTGNLIWEKTFKTRLWDSDTTEGSIDIYDCKQDANGDMYLAGDVRHGGLPRQSLAFKLDISGTVLWSKAFATGFSPSLIGVDINKQRVTFLGKYVTDYGINCLGIVVDATSGDTLSSKILVSTENDFWHAFYEDDMVKLDNGNLALFGRGISDGSTPVPPQMPLHYGILEVTPDLNFVKSWLFRSNEPSNTYNTKISVFKDGSAAYTRMNYISGYNGDVIFGDFKNGQFLKERVIPYRGIGISWISNFLQMNDGGQLVSSFFGDSVTSVSAVELMRLHNSDTASTCLGKDTVTTSVEKETFFDAVPYYDSISVNVLAEDPRPYIGVFNNNFIISSNCKQVSFCDSLKIVIPHDTLCANTAFTIKVRKNKECGAVPSWDYDTSAARLFNRINDSTFSISFDKQWQGYIYSTINGCNTLKDSVKLTVLQSPLQLNLGPDTMICSGKTLLLNAKKGYASYKWQDGSIDSVFTVTKPGEYFVSTTDACGGIFRDTVNVNQHQATILNLGADTVICLGTYILLNATKGYTAYQWQDQSIDSVFTVSQPGKYYVTTKDVCENIFSDTIIVDPHPTVTFDLGADTVICAGSSIVLHAKKGYAYYMWQDGSVNSIFTVTQPGKYFVFTTDACDVVFSDTIMVGMQPTTPPDLGPDTVICPGNTILLHAKNGYAFYQWQDGSVDSLFTVKKPGKYFVTTRNACGTTLSDTVVVTPHPPIPFDAGPDRVKCNGDTIQLHATPGFLNYQWLPEYQFNSSSLEDLIASPLTDTSYTVKAEEIPGCFAYDTVRIKVNHSIPIHLGDDTGFCFGDSVIFNAGNYFSSYKWSNGSTASFIKVKAAGTYFIDAISSEGCHSLDTIAVNVFSNPVVTLDHNKSVCSGDSRLLDAGNFVSYVWNDGSTGKTLLVNKPGIYFVNVTDGKGCRGSDTSVITRMIPAPSRFLPKDTSICSYGTLVIKAKDGFADYLWSTNASSSSITVDKPGIYWLEVIDHDNCTGKEFITISKKDCMLGFYIPNAFTPNKDGRNDAFRPMIFGNLLSYSFVIYNRWGQKVFESNDLLEGWDGTFHGENPAGDVFVWICSYQFAGGNIENRKGTVMLVR
jgi:gliding motility-associated-like protein